MDFADKLKDINKYIDGLKPPRFGATFTDKGFEEAMELLSKSSRRKDSQVAKLILLLSDGMPTVPSSADRWVCNVMN